MNLTGSDGDDMLWGTEADDEIEGFAGADLLEGWQGNDRLSGGDGSDTLAGGQGSDSLSGGAGFDWIAYDLESLYGGGSTGALVDFSAGSVTDTFGTIDIFDGVEAVRATEFADTLRGGAGLSVVYQGLDGADSIIGAAGGLDILDYGGDLAAGGAAGIVANLLAGTVRDGFGQIDIVSSIDEVRGTLFADQFQAGAAAVTFRAGAGNDSLWGGAGDDTLAGEAGDDLIAGGGGADLIDGGAGTDTADYSASPGAVQIALGATGTGGDAEGDALTAVENLIGSSFGDLLAGDGWDNMLDGGGGDDRLLGGAGADTLLGGAANDTLVGGAGADLIDGGAGIDTADYAASGAAVLVTLGAIGIGGDADGDALSDIENLIGSGYDDNLRGNAAANLFLGGAGNDTLFGAMGNDTLDGGLGNDLIQGGAGRDTVAFGGSLAVRVDLRLGGPQDTGQGVDTIINIENITTGSGADWLVGNAGGNLLQGGSGNDTISGLEGNDTLVGELGRDVLNGGLGADVMYGGFGYDLLNGGYGYDSMAGGPGNDTLNGGPGADLMDGGIGHDRLNGGLDLDTMTGGLGQDTFIFNVAPGAANADLITDFSVPDDVIWLENAVFTGLATGTLAASAFVANLSGLAEDSADRIIYETDTGRLYFDPDGTGGAAPLLFATLSSGLALTSADFFVF